MKNINKIGYLILIVAFTCPMVVRAETLQNYIDSVNKYTAELRASEEKVALNDAQIKKITEEIGSIQTQMQTIKADQETLQTQIKENDALILSKQKETKKLINYAQVAGSSNNNLDYIFGASDFTDMIYRISVVEQMSKYNNKIIADLNKLITANKMKKEELIKKDKELKELEIKLEANKNKLGEESAAIREGMPSTQQQITDAEKMVTYYRNKGCNANDVIGVDCAVIKPAVPSYPSGGGSNSIASTGSFHRPINNGYVTSDFGSRSFDGFHYGTDVSSSYDKYNTKVYPIASGEIYQIGYDVYGAKIVRIAHNYNGTIVGSTYVHMASFAPGIYVGMEVSADDYIGIMGESGNAYGVHLHLEVSDCPYLLSGSSCSNSWTKYTNYIKNNWQDPANYIDFPASWIAR